MMKFRYTLILCLILLLNSLLFANGTYDIFYQEDGKIDPSVFSIRQSIYDSLFRGDYSVDWNRDGVYLFVEDGNRSMFFYWNKDGFVDVRQQPLIDVSKYQYPHEYVKKRQTYFGKNMGEKCYVKIEAHDSVLQQAEKGLFSIPSFVRRGLFGQESVVVEETSLLLGYKKKEGSISPFYIRLYLFKKEDVWNDFSKMYERLHQSLKNEPFNKILEGCK